jgi:hypothetical protein
LLQALGVRDLELMAYIAQRIIWLWLWQRFERGGCVRSAEGKGGRTHVVGLFFTQTALTLHSHHVLSSGIPSLHFERFLPCSNPKFLHHTSRNRNDSDEAPPPWASCEDAQLRLLVCLRRSATLRSSCARSIHVTVLLHHPTAALLIVSCLVHA